MSRWRSGAAALVLGAVVSVLGPAGVGASADEPFAPVDSVAGKRLSGRVLFFPLAPEYETCLPLSGPCPEGSAGLVVVRAEGRRVAWQPEGGDLPAVAVATPPVPALGSPPPDPERARYLVPVLDGGGTTVRFAARRLEDGRLVADDDGAAGETAVAPSLAGPVLAAGAPQGPGSPRVVEAPTAVDASALDDAVAVLLVRRAAPSRVVFGLRADAGWSLGDVAYVPLVGEEGVAHLARYNGRVGLAAPAPAGVDPDADDDGPSGDGPGDDEPGAAGDGEADDDDGSGVPVAVVAGAGALAVLLGVGVGAVRRRRRAGPARRRPVI